MVRNKTLDVSVKDCFSDFDTIACARSGTLALFALLTLLLCCWRLLRLHFARHRQWHQYLIFYAASAECLICSVHWLLGGYYPEMDFAATDLKIVQFIIICHFYWALALRILQRDRYLNWIIIPVLTLFLVYFVAVSALGIYHVEDPWIECLQPYWLMISSGDLLMTQMFPIAAYYITLKINTVSTSLETKLSQKRELWSVTAAFELAAFIPAVFDVTVLILGDEDLGCSGIFRHTQSIYSSILFVFEIVKYLVPVWILLIVLRPPPRRPRAALLAGMNYFEDEPDASIFRSTTYGVAPSLENSLFSASLSSNLSVSMSRPQCPSPTGEGRSRRQLLFPQMSWSYDVPFSDPLSPGRRQGQTGPPQPQFDFRRGKQPLEAIEENSHSSSRQC